MTNQTGNLSSCGAGIGAADETQIANPTPEAEAVALLREFVQDKRLRAGHPLRKALKLLTLPQAGEPSPAQEPVAWEDLADFLSDWLERIPGFEDTGNGTIRGRYPAGFQDVEFDHTALAQDIVKRFAPAQPDAGGLREAVKRIKRSLRLFTAENGFSQAGSDIAVLIKAVEGGHLNGRS